MFLLNLGYQWELAADIPRLDGVIHLPAAHTSARFLKRRPFDVRSVLLDPQLYLSGLDRDTCGPTCGRLSTYRWFGVPGVPSWDGSPETRDAWEAAVEKNATKSWPGRPPPIDEAIGACEAALEQQVQWGCTRMVLPAPVLARSGDGLQEWAEWLDAGLKAARHVASHVPLLGTIALDEALIAQDGFLESGTLETVVDNLSARDGVAGAYVVVLQRSDRQPLRTPREVNRAYARLNPTPIKVQR